MAEKKIDRRRAEAAVRKAIICRKAVLEAAERWRDAYDDGSDSEYQEAEERLLKAVDRMGKSGCASG